MYDGLTDAEIAKLDKGFTMVPPTKPTPTPSPASVSSSPPALRSAPHSCPCQPLHLRRWLAALAKWHASLKPRHHARASTTTPPPSSTTSSPPSRSSYPPPTYMDSVQGDISFPMRSILLDWLVEVAAEYHLHSQTIFLCVSYVDRFLSHTPIDRRRLQLVGITCMLIASKYWELYPPTIDDFVYISDHTYAKEQVLGMERAVLTCLKFQLTTPDCVGVRAAATQGVWDGGGRGLHDGLPHGGVRAGARVSTVQAVRYSSDCLLLGVVDCQQEGEGRVWVV